ncbi:MAG: ribonuclease III [bacterium]
MSLTKKLRSLLGLSAPNRRESADPDQAQPKQQGPSRVDLDTVEGILGYRFHDRALLILSLTHRSFTRFDPHHSPSNERLEYLGDSVLGLVVAEQLFRDHPQIHEGDLTKMKAKLVNETTLANVSREVDLHRHLRLSPEEDRAGGRERASIVSDGLESVIAAVYLDGGLESARDVILRLIYSRKKQILSDSSQRNYKGALLEMVQSWGEAMPRYDVLEESGPDHQKTFVVEVHVQGAALGQGTGNSKKEAEQHAAAQALAKIQQQSQDCPPPA